MRIKNEIIKIVSRFGVSGLLLSALASCGAASEKISIQDILNNVENNRSKTVIVTALVENEGMSVYTVNRQCQTGTEFRYTGTVPSYYPTYKNIDVSQGTLKVKLVDPEDKTKTLDGIVTVGGTCEENTNKSEIYGWQQLPNQAYSVQGNLVVNQNNGQEIFVISEVQQAER